MSAFSVVELLCAVGISPEASLLVVEQSDLDWDSLCLISAEDLLDFGIDLEQSTSATARICDLRTQVRSFAKFDTGEEGATEQKPLEEPFRGYPATRPHDPDQSVHFHRCGHGPRAEGPVISHA